MRFWDTRDGLSTAHIDHSQGMTLPLPSRSSLGDTLLTCRLPTGKRVCTGPPSEEAASQSAAARLMTRTADIQRFTLTIF